MTAGIVAVRVTNPMLHAYQNKLGLWKETDSPLLGCKDHEGPLSTGFSEQAPLPLTVFIRLIKQASESRKTVSQVSAFLSVKIFMVELFLKARTTQLFPFITPQQPVRAGTGL